MGKKRKAPLTVATTFKVEVDDNFHYMDKDKRSILGEFNSIDDAIAAAKSLVDNFLQGAWKPGMSAKELFERYQMFGEDPFHYWRTQPEIFGMGLCQSASC